MNQKQAKEALNMGKKIRHFYLVAKYIHKKDGVLRDENGTILKEAEFWGLKTADVWQGNWYEYGQSKFPMRIAIIGIGNNRGLGFVQYNPKPLSEGSGKTHANSTYLERLVGRLRGGKTHANSTYLERLVGRSRGELVIGNEGSMEEDIDNICEFGRRSRFLPLKDKNKSENMTNKNLSKVDSNYIRNKPQVPYNYAQATLEVEKAKLNPNYKPFRNLHKEKGSKRKVRRGKHK